MTLKFGLKNFIFIYNIFFKYLIAIFITAHSNKKLLIVQILAELNKIGRISCVFIFKGFYDLIKDYIGYSMRSLFT